MLFALLDPMLVPRYFLPFYLRKRIQEAIDVICLRGGGFVKREKEKDRVVPISRDYRTACGRGVGARAPPFSEV